MRKSWTDEQLIQAVKDSKSYAEVVKKLNLKNYGVIKYYTIKYNLNTDHFSTKSENIKLADSFHKKMSFSDIFCLNEVDRQYIKKVILKHKLIEYKCQQCQIIDYNNKEIVLQLDHINGINNDNRLENLRFLCPNCHSQTDTYCGRNLRHPPTDPNKCVDCKDLINQYSTRCRKCATSHNRKTKIDWPHTDVLVQLVEEMGYSKAGKQLGVSDKAVKKRINNHPND